MIIGPEWLDEALLQHSVQPNECETFSGRRHRNGGLVLEVGERFKQNLRFVNTNSDIHNCVAHASTLAVQMRLWSCGPQSVSVVSK